MNLLYQTVEAGVKIYFPFLPQETTYYMNHYTVTCSQCKKEFLRNSRRIASAKCQSLKQVFCSKECQKQFRSLSTISQCSNCQKDVERTLSERKKVKNIFCNRSCAATYNNRHKQHGTRRSKLECYIESQIKQHYPNLLVMSNSKSEIGSELDFYFPSLKLAIEINGILHYEPIYGLEKLTQIQKNDKQKFKACHDGGIELCVIATLDGYMKKEVLKKYWNQIQALLSSKLAGRVGDDPTYP